MQRMIKIENPDNFDEMSIQDSETLLHQYARKVKSAAELKKYLAVIPINDANKMALTVNNQGQIPYDILKNRKDLFPEMNECLLLILEISLANQKKIKPLSHPLNINEILNEYKPTRGSLLEYNLKLGAKIVNSLNLSGFHSSTHPQINSKSYSFVLDIIKKIKALSLQANQVIQETIVQEIEKDDALKSFVPSFSKDSKDLNFLYPLNKQINLLKKIAEVFEKNKMGNCNHLSIVALSKIADLAPFIMRAELVFIENGGHIFLVLGRNPSSIIEDCRTWGKCAVAVDVWAREVYPASSLKFSTHKPILFKSDKYQQHFNLVTSFNPNYHIFKFGVYNVGYNNGIKIRYNYTLEEKLSLKEAKLFISDKSIMQVDFAQFERIANNLQEKLEDPSIRRASLYAKACLEMKAPDVQDVMNDYIKLYDKSETDNICQLILFAAVNDEVDLFLSPSMAVLTKHFNLLIYIASIFSSLNYLQQVFAKKLIDLNEVLVALTVAVLKNDFKLLNFIFDLIESSDICIAKLTNLILRKPENNIRVVADPLRWAIIKGNEHAVAFLLAAGFQGDNLHSLQFSYLQLAINQYIRHKRHNYLEIINNLVLFDHDIDLTSKVLTDIQKNDTKFLTLLFQIIKDQQGVKNYCEFFFSDMNSEKYNVSTIIYDYIFKPIETDSIKFFASKESARRSVASKLRKRVLPNDELENIPYKEEVNTGLSLK